MKMTAALIIAFGLTFQPAIGNADETTLVVSSTTPAVNVKARASDRYSIRLPGLHYNFQLEIDCATGYEPDSVLLSIADTRKRFNFADPKADSDDRFSIKIPAAQIAPLSVEGFCLDIGDGGQRESEQITIRGILSAQASLLCSGKEDQRQTYASQALNVTLICGEEAAE